MKGETMNDRIRQLCELLQTAVERKVDINLYISSKSKLGYIRIMVDVTYETTQVEVTFKDMTIRQPHCDRVHITDGALPILMLVDDRDQSAVMLRLPELEEGASD